MTDLVHGDAVEEEQVVGAFSAVHVKPGHKFSPGIHPRKILDGLYEIQRAEYYVPVYEIGFLKPLVPGLAAGFLRGILVGGDHGLRYAVPFFRHL